MDTQPTDQNQGKEEILFPNGNRARLVAPLAGSSAAEVLGELGIEQPEALIMIAGGAGRLDKAMASDRKLRSRLIQLFSHGIARTAAGTGALIIDGGTHSGVMALMGQGVACQGRKSILFGVAPTGLVTYPGGPADGAPLDPNHSHFVLVEGEEWGDETEMMYELAEALAQGVLGPPPAEGAVALDEAEASPAMRIPVVTVLVGGGVDGVARAEVLHSVRHRWPIIVVEGSGGLADEIAKAVRRPKRRTREPIATIVREGRLTLFSLSTLPSELAELLRNRLKGDDEMKVKQETTGQTPRHPALEDAWASFAIYDHNSGIAQKRFVRLRTWILGLGVAATFLAVLHSVLKPVEVPWIAQANGYLRYLIIVIPIAVSVLQAGAAKFKGGTNYILLRGSAEALKREIYRYRAQVGIYGPERTKTERCEVKLARKVKTIGGQLMKTEANQGGLKPYKKDLPPKYGAHPEDDGFSELTADKYLTWRLEDQLTFYRSRIEKFDKQQRRFHWMILGLGGVGTFLAAVGFEIWIAVTVALAGAFVSFLALKQVETTLVAYNQAATDLEGIRIWWHALSDGEKAKQENKERLVEYTEKILQTELAGWVQEMMDALAELYEETETAGEATES